MIPHESITALHEHYRAISGMDIQLTMAGIFTWEAWLAAGYVKKDLDLVVSYLKRRLREKKTPIESLKLSNLIGRTDKFNEDLAIAKAELRAFKPQSQRQKILTATGRADTKSDTTKSTQSIIGQKPITEMIADLRKAVV